MAKTENKTHSPLFHIVKREPLPWYGAWGVRAGAIVLALLLSAVVVTILTKTNPIEIYKAMFQGAFGSSNRIWNLLQQLSMLLCQKVLLVSCHSTATRTVTYRFL